jgi:hypothetical protein
MMSNTKKWSVSIPWHASVCVRVEADTAEEAIEKAIEIAQPSLCHQCSDEIELGEWNNEVSSDAIEVNPR